MLTPVFSSRFKKDYKLCQKRGLNMPELNEVMGLLEKEIPLDAKYKDHPLKNNWSGFKECHINPDWLLIYQIDKKANEIYFVRTGTHSDLLE